MSEVFSIIVSVQSLYLVYVSGATDIFVDPVSETEDTPQHGNHVPVDNVRSPIIRNCRSASLPHSVTINLQKVEISPVCVDILLVICSYF